jgi:hypothetical protein
VEVRIARFLDLLPGDGYGGRDNVVDEIAELPPELLGAWAGREVHGRILVPQRTGVVRVGIAALNDASLWWVV